MNLPLRWKVSGDQHPSDNRVTGVEQMRAHHPPSGCTRFRLGLGMEFHKDEGGLLPLAIALLRANLSVPVHTGPSRGDHP